MPGGPGVFIHRGACIPKIFVTASLTRLDVSYNNMGDGGVKLLRDALRERQGFDLRCEGNEDEDLFL